MSSFGTQINMTLHTRPISTTRFFGDYLFVTSLDNLVSIWDLKGSLISTFEGHNGAVWTIDVDDFAVSGGSDKKFFLWDITNGKIISQQENNSTVKNLNIMKNGCFVVTDDSYNSKSMVGFYDKRSCKMERIYFPENVATQVVNCFINDHDYFNYNGDIFKNNDIKNKDVKDHINNNTNNDIINNDISTKDINKINDTSIIFSDVLGFINILDLRNLKIIEKKKIHDSKITELKKSKCNSFLISSSSDMTTKIIDYDLSVKKTFISNDPVNSSALTAKNDKLLNAGGIPARDVTTTKSNLQFDVNFYDVVTEKYIGSYSTHFGTINSVDIFGDDVYVSGGEDGIVCMVKVGEDFKNAPFTKF
ncbi:Eukaryotic translation initiation factor 3 subunit I [Dictyocoela muelleri]|nr:Eukaryotic translation initiation factor 3 subunit I [Dictyocoela muelleri]